MTSKEKEELNILRIIQSSSTRFMSMEEKKRLDYLQGKQWHNKCYNPRCTGYEGKEEEIHCPKCGKPLFKAKAA